MEMPSPDQPDRENQEQPGKFTIQVRSKLNDVIVDLRNQIQKTDDLQAQALFETTAEVLSGLVKAYEHFEQKNEAAWRNQES